MKTVPKVAAINDLSGLGKCSLTAAIPVLSALGVQACPLPTAVLSNQTGFDSYHCVDLTGQMDAFVAEWKKRVTRFDGIYTGFLCNLEQVEQVARFIDVFREEGTRVFVDPVVGDNGKIYPVFTHEMCGKVHLLVEKADVVTPNLTEACLLTGTSFDGLTALSGTPDYLERIWALAEQITRIGPETVIITGVFEDAFVHNIGYCKRDGRRFHAKNRRVAHGYSGTGDLTASMLCGGMVRGMSPEAALDMAVGFLEHALPETCAQGTDPNEGICFEPYLYLLTERVRAL